MRVGNIEACQMPTGTTVFLGERGVSVPQIIFEQMEPGQQILLDDGKILLEALEIIEEPERARGIKELENRKILTEDVRKSGGKSAAICRVLRGGILKSRKSIVLPGLEVHSPTLTESDRANLKLAGKYGVTGVMLPFVRSILCAVKIIACSKNYCM